MPGDEAPGREASIPVDGDLTESDLADPKRGKKRSTKKTTSTSDEEAEA